MLGVAHLKTGHDVVDVARLRHGDGAVGAVPSDLDAKVEGGRAQVVQRVIGGGKQK